MIKIGKCDSDKEIKVVNRIEQSFGIRKVYIDCFCALISFCERVDHWGIK